MPNKATLRAPSQAEALLAISFQGLILPERMPPHTELLDLDPLPLAALGNEQYQAMYTGRFTHFNPIQTQARLCEQQGLQLMFAFRKRSAT